MTALTSALTTALIDFAWQGVVVACLLWITLLILRNRSAHARYLAASGALLTMLALPLLTALISFEGANHPVVPASAVPAVLVSYHVAPTSGAAIPWLLALQAWALPAWSLGVLLFSFRLTFGCWQLSMLKRRGIQAPESVRAMVDNLAARMGLPHTVRVLMSTLTDAPSVVGFLRPIILLPVSSLSGLSPLQLEAILAHELAHILRYDALVNALQIFVETLLFYHPAVWWASARIRHERELCCDDLALDCCRDVLCYARALTALEKLRGSPAALAVGSTGGSLLYRIRRITGERPTGYSPSKLSGILALALALFCLAVNFNSRMHAQDRAQTAPKIWEGPGVKVETAGAEVLEPIRYPRSAAEKAIQGTVVVQVDVDPQGSVTDARVLSGPPELRKAALQPVLTWRFKPEGTAGTRQISVAFQVPPLQELQEYRRENSAASAEEAEAGARRRMELDAARQSAAQSSDDLARDSEGYERSRREMRVLEESQSALQSQLEQLEKMRTAGNREETNGQQAQVADAVGRIQQLQQQLVEAERRMSDARLRSPHEMSGRVLARIDIAGLSEEQRVQLINQLPVKIGDTLSTEAVERIEGVIAAVDERLRFQLVPLENNQTVLKIGAIYYTRDGQPSMDPTLAELRAHISRLERQLSELQNAPSQGPDVLEIQARLQELRAQRDRQMALLDMRRKEAADRQQSARTDGPPPK